MKHLASATSVLLLAACTTVPPAAPKLPPEQPQPPSAAENVPYPIPDLQSQIDNMGIEIAKLLNDEKLRDYITKTWPNAAVIPAV
ncbi:MAG: hypothetical protein ACFNKE_02525 [Neisseria elongata]